MKGMDLFKLELLKMKRSRMIALLSAAPILVVVSGVVNLSQYLTPEYTQAWPAMFIQKMCIRDRRIASQLKIFRLL